LSWINDLSNFEGNIELCGGQKNENCFQNFIFEKKPESNFSFFKIKTNHLTSSLIQWYFAPLYIVENLIWNTLSVILFLPNTI
jgi:hypothetical protein